MKRKREHEIDRNRQQTIIFIKGLLHIVRNRSGEETEEAINEARNRILNVTLPSQQIKFVDKWKIPDKNLTIDSLGQLSIC